MLERRDFRGRDGGRRGANQYSGLEKGCVSFDDRQTVNRPHCWAVFSKLPIVVLSGAPRPSENKISWVMR